MKKIIDLIKSLIFGNGSVAEKLEEVKTREESIINGIIDYVGHYNDNIILVDWKTGMSQKYASLNQLKFYSLLKMKYDFLKYI